MSMPPENDTHPVDESTLPPENPASPPKEQTPPPDVTPPPSKAPPTAPAALSSPSEAPPPTTLPTRKRPTDLHSSDLEHEQPPPPKRVCGRPKGSKKNPHAEQQAGPVEKRSLRLEQGTTSKRTPVPANEAPYKIGTPKGSGSVIKNNSGEPRKRGRPKGSGTGVKANTSGTGKEEDNAKAVGKTDGTRKRGRPKKEIVRTESNAVAGAEEATAEKPVEVKKRGRPRKGT
ncbi:MAG: hypothetical protein Q9208_008563 [Pyrenodesmia sp. 3 TL-2023]